jgi:amino acid transporter
MPLNANEVALLEEPVVDSRDYGHQRVEFAPSSTTKIGKFTVVALILNRTIGSGIFLTPHRILAGTGCVGGALLLWVLGALVSLCGLYVWLECGLSMPQRKLQNENQPRGVPRSGGEKNFLEFMFPNTSLRLPHIRTTCSFSIMFILMYNLSGNAISFGLQVMVAAGIYNPTDITPPPRGIAVGIAIGTLTFVVLLHMFSRRGGILLNNIFAIVKVALLLTIIILGVVKGAGGFGGSEGVARRNFTQDVWKTSRSDAASWSNSLLLCMYSFSGYEQPFYILAEVKSPRRYFPRYTVAAMLIAAALFILVNISFLLVVDKTVVIDTETFRSDMASLFFDKLFNDDRDKATRAMAALIAISIFGNLVVMTFTAARVKQEIAKEGILPQSLFFATSYTTPYGLWKRYTSHKRIVDEDIERAPTAAFGLHWFTSILLVLVTIPITDSRKAYGALVSLYSYTIVGVLGCWVSIGLLKLKIRKNTWQWAEPRRRYRPWLSPIHPIIYLIATAFMLVAAFIPPQRGSPYHRSITGYDWFIIPTIGITAPFWGVLWYWGMLVYEWKIGKHLDVTRQAYWMQDPDCPSEYVQRAEVINHSWPITARDNMSDHFADAPTPDEAKGGLFSRRRPAPPSDDSSIFEMSKPGRGPVTGARRLSDGFAED